VSDLADGAPSRRPLYASAMNEAGIRAIFAFPRQVGAARLGPYDVFRTRPGSFSSTELVRAFQLTGGAVPGAGHGHGPARRHARGGDGRIRAYAYANNRHLADVARDIVRGRLRFDRDE